MTLAEPAAVPTPEGVAMNASPDALPEGMRVPAGMLVLGVPARVVRPVDDALAARARETWEHYLVQARRHRAGAVVRHPVTRS